MQSLLDLAQFMGGQDEVLLVLGLAFMLLSLFLHLFQLWQLTRLNKRYKRLLGGRSGEKTLEEILVNYFNSTRLALDKVQDLEGGCQRIGQKLKYSVQKIGLVRYNAFPNAAGDQSFALALLNGQGDGVVLSSLYGRNESRIYGKPVLKGTSTYHLTTEERAAIGRALEKGP